MNEEDEYIQNKGLIFLAIKKMHLYWKTPDERQDIEDAGTDGLLQGIRTYSEDKGYKKSTYYYTCIKNEISKMLYLKTMQKRTADVVSLNKEISEEFELLELIPGETNLEAEALNKEKAKILNELVDSLPIEKDREVIRYRYGLKGYPVLNGEQIGKKWGVNKNAIYHRERRALVQLWLRIRGNERNSKLFEE